MRWFPLLLRPFCMLTALLLLGASPVLAQERMPLSTTSDDAQTAYRAGLDHLFNAHPDAARPHFEAALQADPSFAMAAAMRAAGGTTYDDRMTYLKKAKALADGASPGEKVYIDLLAARMVNDRAGVKAACDDLLRLHPQDPEVQYMTAVYARYLDDPEASLDRLRAAVAVDPEFAPAYNLLGYAHMEAGDSKAAEKAFRTYVRLRPDDPNPHDSLGDFYLSEGRFEDAATRFRTAVDRDPTFVMATAKIGVAQMFAGDGVAARSTLRNALADATTPGTKVYVYDRLAESYVLEGEMDAARAVYAEGREAVEADLPDRGPHYLHLQAWLHIEEGNSDDADRLIDEAGRLIENASGPEGMQRFVQSRNTMIRTYAAVMRGDLTAAERYASAFAEYAAASGDPDDVQTEHDLRGVIAMKKGDAAGAVAHFKQGSLDDPFVQYQLANAYKADGHAKKAAAHFKKAAHHNQPSLGYALVRAKAMSEVM